ncbi:MAG: phycobiliprotein lyase [Symploca sp. SIO2B6]|nr:phycobiliprotein lyase [Symploca sp. SIO2B6]
MDIKEFVEQSAGKWFSQRSNHYLSTQPTESGQSNLVMELLLTNDPEVIQICQGYNIEPATALYGVKVTWEGTIKGKTQKQTGSNVIVLVPDVDRPKEGKILQSIANSEKTPHPGRYIMAEDDSLTMITENEKIYSEERFWFASPNLRLRTSLVKLFGGFTQASMSSEIRMGITKSVDKAEDSAAKVPTK